MRRVIVLERERCPRVARILSKVFFIFALSTTVESASELTSVITDRRNIGLGQYKTIGGDNLICQTEVLYYC